MTGRHLAAFFLALVAGPLLAQDPNPPETREWGWIYLRKQPGPGPNEPGKVTFSPDGPRLPDAKEFDKLVVDSLREVHNRGADLFNPPAGDPTGGDPAGAYRLYQGALLTVRPLLAHRPKAQKLIDEGFKEADKESTLKGKAFKLHEAIEAVRAYLKDPGKDSGVLGKKPLEVTPTPKEKEPKKEPKEAEPKKEPKNPNPVSTNPVGISGKVLLKGAPLTAAEVTLVTLDQAKPLVFTAQLAADGSYSFKEQLPPGRYVVIVTAKAVPEKYSTTTTSGIVVQVKPGGVFDIDLK